MSSHQDHYSFPDDLQPVAPLRRRRPSRPFWSIFSTLMLGLVVLTGLMGNGPLPASKTFTATLQKPVKGVTTYQQFMKLARSTPTHKTLTRQLTIPTSKASLASTKAVKKSTAKVLPSVEPAKMKPIVLSLSPNVLAANQAGTLLKQLSSDQHLEVQIAPGTLNATNARLVNGTTPATVTAGGLTLQITQRSGHYAGISSILGTYAFNILDQQGHAIQGLTARHPITIIYHYQPGELKALGIDPGRVTLSWPDLLIAARAGHKPTTGLSMRMINNAKTHTLTAQSSVVTASTFALASVPTVQQPPKAHLASVQGNSGNLTYSYPMQLPPGPGGFTPQLAFNYSSAMPNGRHSPLTPADSMGDGWTLGMGSITAENYPDSSAGGNSQTRFSLSGPDGVSDMLVPDPNNVDSFFTEHISHEKISGTNMNSSTDTPDCFHVWDTSGNYYEYGCSSDSLQQVTDGNGNQTTYRWDLNRIVSSREGPNSPSKQIKITYFQDMHTDSNGNDSVRDAVMAQIVYETVIPATSTTKIVGTVDFQYLGDTSDSSESINTPSGAKSSWITDYSSSSYKCSKNTNQRCDTPVDDNNSGVDAPKVMSSFSLQGITSYVGADTAKHPAYGYSFQYLDTPYVKINDPITQDEEYAAGEHLLTTITPTQYLGGTSHKLKDISFSYTDSKTVPLTQNTYYDSQETNDNGSQYQVKTNWQYLNYYVDLNTNIGESVNYQTAFSNTHGTPYVTDSNGVIIDDRHDPFYCPNHANDSDHSKRCSGHYAHPDDQSWSVQVVTNREALGKDSSDPNLQPATYNYTYTLGVWGNYQDDFSGNGDFCYPAGDGSQPGQNDCVFDTFIPGTNGGGQDHDWQDYYHGEFHGFGKVYTVPPDGDLEVQTYYTPESWGTPETDAQNYQSGQMIKDDKYWGDGEVDGQLISETVNQYSGTSDFLPSGASAYSTACMDTSVDEVYTPCEMVKVFSKTTTYEQNGTAITNAPWVQTTDTYDDYNTSGGLQSSGYHNVIQEQTTSSNAPTITKKSTYATNDSSHNSFTYYTVNKVKHSEVDDAAGHVWQCQDTTYDEGVSSLYTPASGLATTVKTYSDCSHQSTTALTSYTAYDGFGNTVGTVDAFGAANSSLYGGNGCTLATAPAVLSSSWTKGHYTTCMVYDSYAAQATNQQDVLRQNTSTIFDDTQDRLPTSSIDITGQATSVNYSIDSNGNQALQDKDPGEMGSYTSQSSTYSSCDFGSNLPCYEIDGLSYQYPNAVTRTFYDSQGQATETRKPLDATHDLVTFTVHNEWNDSVFVSQQFRVAKGSRWIDPLTATDDQGNIPAGTITVTDPLGRAVATRDPIEGTVAEPGITCASGNVQGTWTTCVGYGLGSPDPSSSTQYDYTVDYDANNHKTVAFQDTLGRTRFVKTYSSVTGSINDNIMGVTETQYNALNKPTAVIVTDTTPQSGQVVSSVTMTATYDDIGHVIILNDPDRGTHAYTYDADGHQLTDTSSSHTIGISYDLLGRAICMQDAAPTTDGSGHCSNGSHPLVQNSYGTSYVQLLGTTNYITGRLGQSIATTYYPDGSSVATTEQFEYDQRGRTVATNLSMSVPNSWNMTTVLPTYQQTQTYNDDNQLMMTKTTAGGKTGYTFSQAYDSTTGNLIGLSNNSTGVANLASLSFNSGGLFSDINFQTTSGTALADVQLSYDGNQRLAGANATWQSGSGTSGTIFSTSRSYDPVGNVASSSLVQSAVSGQTNSGGSETQNFCNDAQNRLVWAGNNSVQPLASNVICGTATLGNSLNGANYNNSYAYTNLGQIWQAPLNGTGGSQQYLYCDSSHPHQLTGVYPIGTTCATTSGATALYSARYDNWGNETSRIYGTTSATLSYNVSDQLVQWNGIDSGNSANNRQEWYAYDTGGNRVLLRDISGGNTRITTYAFGLEEHSYDGSGNSTSNTYYYSLSGRLIGQFDGTNTQFDLSDELGSILAVFSDVPGSASVLANQVYGPYGNKQYSTGTIGTSKGYTGQYSDVTGLDYYIARYYDPVVGRFLSADTIQGNAYAMNPYAYVSGNPETKNDPTGHCDAACLQTAELGTAAAGAAGIELGPGDVLVMAGAFLVIVIASDVASHSQNANTNFTGETDTASLPSSTVSGVAKNLIDNGSPPAKGWSTSQEESDLVPALASKAKAERAKVFSDYKSGRSNQNPQGSNAAAALLTIWDGKSWQNMEASEIGYSGPGQPHAEETLVKWATGILQKSYSGKTGLVVNLLIATQTNVCYRLCAPSLDGNQWLKSLYNATGVPPGQNKVFFDVFQGNYGTQQEGLWVPRYFGYTDGSNTSSADFNVDVS